MTSPWVVAGIFVTTFVLIVTDRIDRTLVALTGALAMILLGVVDQARAFAAVDWNVIFLLIGMMIIAGVLSETGAFQWVAVQSVRLGRGDPWRTLVILSVVTAVASAILDNVTVIVLVAPITLFVAGNLRASPVPFLIAEVLASNIGGTATLIGDPPNVLVGSAAGIDFATFAGHMAPVGVLSLAAFIAVTPRLFRADLARSPRGAADLDALSRAQLISDPVLLRRALVVLVCVVVGFLVHAQLRLEPATIAIAGATVLMLWGRLDANRLLREVEWATLFFFIGLFITVDAVVAVGLIDRAAEVALAATGGGQVVTSLFLLWFSAAASGVIDNIPYTATMIPVVRTLGQHMPIETLWWALALGACLGGNATLVGASANIVAANLAARSGHPISFRTFSRYGIPTTLLTLVVATLYVWLRYLSGS